MHNAGRKNGQDARWLQQVRRSGTTSDKVAALTLLLQESAVANLKSLDALLNWVLKRKGGRNVVAQVLAWHAVYPNPIPSHFPQLAQQNFLAQGLLDGSLIGMHSFLK